MKFIHVLHTFDKKFFLFLCCDNSEYNDTQGKHLSSNLYCKNADIFLDITNKLREKFTECQKLNLVRQVKRLLNIV